MLFIRQTTAISLSSDALPTTSYRVPLGSRVNFLRILPRQIAISMSEKINPSSAICSKKCGITNS